jgi:hypothetical protein
MATRAMLASPSVTCQVSIGHSVKRLLRSKRALDALAALLS